MSQAYQTITIQDIPTDVNFEGYYWCSNEQNPEIIIDEPIQLAWFTDLPFVIEANFYSSDAKLSLQVRHVDGQYQVARIDLSQTSELVLDEVKTYLGHDLEGQNFQVIHAWQPESDPFCAGMPVLVPAWSAFAGFSTPNSPQS
jgi:CRISPR type III-associated protein (TIGR04423 family)